MIQLIQASAFQIPLANESVQMVVTSPPYWGLRKYSGGQGATPYGEESTIDQYVSRTVAGLQEIKRVLKCDGVCFWNVGDTYNKKHLCLIPERVAIAAQDDGWFVRSMIIWAKTNPMPEPVRDRPTRSYEHVIMLSKSAKYYWDQDAVREPMVTTAEVAKTKWKSRREGVGKGQQEGVYHGYKSVVPFQNDPNPLGRNIRNTWTISTQAYRGAHFATFPEELPRRCIKAASRLGDIVLDPFCGSGTTGKVALELGRNFIGLDLAYQDLAKDRISSAVTALNR